MPRDESGYGEVGVRYFTIRFASKFGKVMPPNNNNM